MENQHNHHHSHHHKNSMEPDNSKKSQTEPHKHAGHEQPVGPMQEHVNQKAQDDHGGHNEHAGHHTEDFLKRFWLCLALTVPVLLLSHMIQQWLGFGLAFTGDKWLLLALSSFIYVYGGWPFLMGIVRELKHRNPGMMTLVAVAISTAYIYIA